MSSKAPAAKTMIGSLQDLVSLPGMPSEPTIRKLIDKHADFPILKRGKNGDAYEFDLGAAAKFIVGLREKEETEARARAEEVRQFGLDLLGPDAVALDAAQVGLSPAERKALLEEELAAIKLRQIRGELVKKASVEAALAEFLVWLAQRQASFSARLAKRADVPREVLLAVDRLMEADRAEIAARMEQMQDAGDQNDEPVAGDPAVRDGSLDLPPPGGGVSAEAASDGQRVGGE